MTCWSNLVYDALERITSFLPLIDHYQFSAVCKNWRLVAKQKRHSPAPQLPWLVLGDEPSTGRRKFYNLSEDKHYAMDIPELCGRHICGFSHGWLVAIDIKFTGILINPFTREFYELPLFPHFNIDLHSRSVFEKALMDYRDVAGYCIEDFQVSIVQKAILSHDPKEKPDFMLMILVGLIGTPAFWKPGDSSWTVIRVRVSGIKDVIYFDQHFYFVTNHNRLLFLDFQPDPKMHDIRSPRISLRLPTPQSYLVNYFGNLLLVERWDRLCIKKRYYKTYFNILRLDFEKKKVYRSKTIGEAAIFLGTNDSIVINPNELVPGCKYKCKTKSIYFTDDDMGIFNTSEKTFSAFYPPEIHHTRVGAPIWFTPNPW